MYPRFFDASALGRSLREVSADVLPPSTDPNVISRWFHSEKECDLFIWTDREANILKQQLSFFGQVVEWNIVEGLKTGLVVEDERQNASRTVAASEIIRFDQQPQPTPVEQAIALLNHMTALQERERQALLGNFTDPGVGTGLPAEEFMRRFGALLASPSARRTARTDSWWRRLRRLFRRYFA
jgi:hypothetical protein